MRIRIGTRGSDLALWQARTVRGWLEAEPGVEVEIVVLQTKGDRIDDMPLQKVEGKGFFTAEIERALLAHDVDVAVHSHKDLATENPAGLTVAGVPSRGPTAEVLLVRPERVRPQAPFLPLANGANVGTSAPRRGQQLAALRPDLAVQALRGNVPTRLRKLREGQHDAIVLAAAGVRRLELDLADLAVFELPWDLLVPAPAQGALAVQVRAGDEPLLELVRRRIHDPGTARAVAAERRVLAAAGGGCSLPLGALIRPEGGGWSGRAFLGAGFPRAGAPARWAAATGADPDRVAADLLAALETGSPTGVGPFRGWHVALAGSGRAGGALAERLTTLGARVTAERAIRTVPLDAPELEARLAELGPGDVLAVTSRAAAERLAGHSVPAGVLVAAVGPATARALDAAGLAAGHIGSGGAAELARSLPLAPGARVLFPCAQEPRPELVRLLRERGASVVELAIYRTEPEPEPEITPAVDARVYMSPSSVESLSPAERGQGSACLRVALGSSTWETLRSSGLDGSVAPGPDDGSGPEAAVRVLARQAGTRVPTPS